MEESNSVPGHNPFAPPVARVEDASALTNELADRGVRLVAAILDGVAVGVIALVTGIIAAVFGSGSPMSSDPGLAIVGIMAIGFLGFAGLQIWLLHERSQTLGKIVMKIRIVRSDGSKPSIGRLVGLRFLPMFLAGLVPLIGPLVGLVDSLMIFRDSHRCLHDDIADTLVVRV